MFAQITQIIWTKRQMLLVLWLFAFQNVYSKDIQGKTEVIHYEFKISEMRGALLGGSSHSDPGINPSINGDTIRLSYNKTWILFSGMLLEKNFPRRSYRSFKINSVIRGEFDTINYLPIITAINPIASLENLCPNNKFETNKDYLILNVIDYQKGRESVSNKDTIGSQSRYTKCENILPDTPENRELLIKKYEKAIIVNEPKPGEAKKE